MGLSESANDMYIVLLNHDQEVYQAVKNAYNHAYAHRDDPYYAEKVQEYKERMDNYEQFGYEGLDYHGMYPTLENQKAYLARRFREKYAKYRIGPNTMSMFNARLQSIFDDIADEYELKMMAQSRITDWFKNGDLSLKLTTKFDDWSTSDDKSTDLPDTFGDNIAHLKNEGERHNNGSRDTIDSTISTKLNTMLSLLSVRRRVLQDYLNEFGPAFQAVVW